jgi:Siphovirus ReqiPepy6 Gp37-like protein
MELYTLDPLLRRDEIVDQFESLIWTERFNRSGDFELKIRSTTDTRRIFKTGLMLACNLSHRVMTVEAVENNTDADGKKILKVTGPSLENILDDRVARAAWASTTTTPAWTLTGTPAAIMRQIFHDICVTGVLNVGDKVPFINEGNVLYPVSTIGESVTSITVNLDPTTVLQAEQDLGTLYDMGFRLYRNYDQGQLYFDVYAGSDRTTGQTALPAVVFSPELDNLQNTTEYTSISGAKNIAYVISPVGWVVVAATSVDPAVAGFDRHVLLVNATDITDSVPATATARMTQRGTEELSKNRVLAAFDGEINQNSQYKYMTDYQLGDMVEVRNQDGTANKMRVTEQILVQDAEGERQYPTLALNTFITAGSWLAWDGQKKWIDYDADTTTVWGTLP